MVACLYSDYWWIMCYQINSQTLKHMCWSRTKNWDIECPLPRHLLLKPGQHVCHGVMHQLVDVLASKGIMADTRHHLYWVLYNSLQQKNKLNFSLWYPSKSFPLLKIDMISYLNYAAWCFSKIFIYSTINQWKQEQLALW